MSTNATRSEDKPKIKYPPFPKVPEGITITPFKDFKESGIQIFSGDDGIEIDGLGVPTVSLRVKHDTDDPKSEARRQKKELRLQQQQERREAEVERPATAHLPGQRRPPYPRKHWYEHWAEGEDLRVTENVYNPNTSRLDRMYQASTDFRLGRRWPPVYTRVGYLWDQFRIFIGLLGVTPIWHRTDLPNQNYQDETLSDDEYDSEVGESPGPSRSNIYVNEQNDSPDQSEPPRKSVQRQRNRPPYAHFGAKPILVDSDEAVKRLLEDEVIRREGRVEAFLNDPERMVKVFLSSYMRQEGLHWTDQYLDYIPRILTFFLNFLLRNHVLPESHHQLIDALKVVQQAHKELPLTSKISKLVPDEFSLSCTACWGPKKEIIPFESALKEEELKATDVQLDDVKDSGPDTIAKEALEDNLDDEYISLLDRWDLDPSIDNTIVASAADLWAQPKPHSLMFLLGPTSLPNTHTPGVVESSMRRVKSLLLPSVDSDMPKLPVSADGPDPDAVEAELERKFAKIVLSPWVGWEPGSEVLDLSMPKLLTPDEDQPSIGDAVKPHDPTSDDITLLVHPFVLNSVLENMGLAGTFVQLKRNPNLEGKKKKGRKTKSPANYWYIEELTLSIPSYWTVEPDVGI